jgi:hypothetical protein
MRMTAASRRCVLPRTRSERACGASRHSGVRPAGCRPAGGGGEIYPRERAEGGLAAGESGGAGMPCAVALVLLLSDYSPRVCCVQVMPVARWCGGGLCGACG